MQNLVERMGENGVVEEYYVTWGALVVLEAKPCKGSVPWHE